MESDSWNRTHPVRERRGRHLAHWRAGRLLDDLVVALELVRLGIRLWLVLLPDDEVLVLRAVDVVVPRDQVLVFRDGLDWRCGRLGRRCWTLERRQERAEQ